MHETAALITAIILDRPLCLDCIALKAGVGPATADASLARIKNVLTEETGRCRACGTIGVVFSARQP